MSDLSQHYLPNGLEWLYAESSLRDSCVNVPEIIQFKLVFFSSKALVHSDKLTSNLGFREKAAPQIEQICVLSEIPATPFWLCCFSWTVRLWLYANDLSQNEHLNGLSPIWNNSKIIVSSYDNSFPFQPSITCVRWWPFKCDALRNSLSHFGHLILRILSWVIIWKSNDVTCTNTFPHLWHWCSGSPAWIAMCLTKLPFFVRTLLQHTHSYGDRFSCNLQWSS